MTGRVPSLQQAIMMRSTFQDKFISHIKERTGAGLGIRQILLLVIGKAFLIYNCDFAFMLHIVPLFSSTFSFRSIFLITTQPL